MRGSQGAGARINGVEWEGVPGQPVCDFCLGRDPIWDYPADDVVVVDMDHKGVNTTEYYGVWCACEPCAALIEAKDEKGLAERAAAGNGAFHPNGVKVFGFLVHQFMKARTGPRTPF